MFQTCYYHQDACLLVCLSLLSVSQTSVDDSGHQRNTTLEFKSSGCAVSNNLISVCLCRKGEGGGWGGGGVSPGEPQPNLKKEELDKTSTFRGGLLGKRE